MTFVKHQWLAGLSVINSVLKPIRWWMACAFLTITVCSFAGFYLNQQANTLEAKRQEAVNRATMLRQKTKVTDVKSAALQPALQGLTLPTLQEIKVAPLGSHLTEPKARGISIEQLEYVWPKTSAGSARARIGRLDVNLQLGTNYSLFRPWLAQLLIDKPHLQISSLQVQRASKDSSNIKVNLTLAVYFEGEL